MKKHVLDNANSSDFKASPLIQKVRLDTLKALLNEFGLITDVSFELFKCEPLRPAKVILLLDFSSIIVHTSSANIRKRQARNSFLEPTGWLGT